MLDSLRLPLAVAFPRKSLQNVSIENAAAGKLCSFLHQIEDRVFALATDDGQAAHVDHQFASVQVTAGVFPGGAKFRYPGFDELSFHHQPALRWGIDDGNLEHVDWQRIT